MTSTNRFNHITYESLGIDPVSFYSGKFAGEPGLSNYLGDPINYYDIELDRIQYLVNNLQGSRILDIGCGSAPYGQTIRSNCKVDELVGVDMDEECIEVASQIYDKAIKFEIGKKLPFEDGYFDTVFSCDFFGHIEFQHKNDLIKEIFRITKPNGKSVHIIESGAIDYDKINIDDLEDPMLQYINMEGHVGIETAEDIGTRWREYFSHVDIENAFIFPLATTYTFMANTSIDPGLKEYFRQLTPSERRAAHVALGFSCQELKKEIREIDSTLLTPDHKSKNPIKRPCGLIYLTASN